MFTKKRLSTRQPLGRGKLMAFKCRKCKTEKTINEYGTDVHNLCVDCTDSFHYWLGE